MKSLTAERAETLFESEALLRAAALKYATAQNQDNRKALREAALAYADFASFLDDLINADELPDELAKQVGASR